MKKKLYFIIYSIVQIILGIIAILQADQLAQTTLNTLEESFDFNLVNSNIFTLNSIRSSVIFSSVLLIIISIIFLILVYRESLFKKKGLTIGLLIVTFFCSMMNLSLLLAIISLVIVLADRKDKLKVKEKDESKSVKRLRDLKVTNKDLLLGAFLTFIYLFFQFSSFPPMSIITAIVITVLFYVIIFLLVFYVFRKRFKRDFSAFKDNFSSYVKYIFKMWGVMILFSLLSSFVAAALGASGVSENQASLNELSMWIVIPLSCIWAPIVEESIFRGVVRRFISKNDKLFVIVSAILFGLLHTVGQQVGIYDTIVYALQYMAMGGVLAYTYVKSNNICTNIGVHFVQNLFASIVMLIAI